MRPAGLVLAGGLSRRMGGGDKTLLPLAGQPLIAHVLHRLRPQVDVTAVSANGDPKRFEALDVPVLPDTIPDHAGPLAGVLAGLQWASKAGFANLVTVAGDTPFFPPDLVPRLVAAAGDSRLALAHSAGRSHPVFALWPAALRCDMESFLLAGNRRVMDFAADHDAVPVDFSGAGTEPHRWGCRLDPFFNINTPDDLREAERLLEVQRFVEAGEP